jgi:nitroreductase
MKRFWKYSSLKNHSRDNILTRITTTYHIIEKGLALTDPRYGFGADKILRLITLLQEYKAQKGDTDNSQYQAGISVLESYLDWNENHTDFSSGNPAIFATLRSFLEGEHEIEGSAGGWKQVSRESYIASGRREFGCLSQSRSSIRSFSGENVKVETIGKIVSLAQKSPSTCNRQTTRVHLYSSREQLQKILAIHKGTRGFSEEVNRILIITGDLAACEGTGDRNQVYVDSGLFAMNLLYGLQFEGLGACILHWNVTPQKDKKLRKVISIPAEQTIVCLIALGHLPETFKVPVSRRKHLGEIFTEH